MVRTFPVAAEAEPEPELEGDCSPQRKRTASEGLRSPQSGSKAAATPPPATGAREASQVHVTPDPAQVSGVMHSILIRNTATPLF